MIIVTHHHAWPCPTSSSHKIPTLGRQIWVSNPLHLWHLMNKLTLLQTLSLQWLAHCRW
jgi:hypothetical protein